MKVGDLVKDKYDTAPGIVMDMDFSEEMPIRVYYKHTGEFSLFYKESDLEIVSRYKSRELVLFLGAGLVAGFLVGLFL
tara:strand:- start:223 stop:456 length:234 start_codon:yes stop_codon:yes gene_type:complete